METSVWGEHASQFHACVIRVKPTTCSPFMSLSFVRDFKVSEMLTRSPPGKWPRFIIPEKKKTRSHALIVCEL